MQTVNLNEKLPYDTIEEAIMKAAEERGLRVGNPNDKYDEEIFLGSVRREQVYGSTTITLWRGILPFAQITALNRHGEKNFFFVEPYFATKGGIDSYLVEVSEHLSSD